MWSQCTCESSTWYCRGWPAASRSELVAERAHAGAGVDDDAVTGGRADLDARRLAAVAHGGRAGHRVTAPDPPEGDLHRVADNSIPLARIPQSSARFRYGMQVHEPAAEDPRDGRRWHRRHRRGDADRDRLGRHRGLDERRRSAPRSTRPASASSTRARSAWSAAGSRRRPRASTTCASSRPSRPTSRTPRARPCPTSPTTRRSSCCRTACARSASRAIVGAERVIGAIVAWGASMPEPGRYERTAAGGFRSGGSTAQIDDDLRRVARAARGDRPGDADRRTCAARGGASSRSTARCRALGTIAGERLGPLVRVRRYRRLALEMMTEAVAVAQRRGRRAREGRRHARSRRGSR